MNILLIGGGGREHALAWKITQSNRCSQLYIAPGNPGTAQCGINIAIDVNDFVAIDQLCREKEIGMVIIGPEDPLVKGIADTLKAALPHMVVVGPSAEAAQLEGSKAFAKAFMNKYHIPTATYFEFDESTYETGVKYIEQHSLPIVLKADGLAAGKGVVIAETHAAALESFKEMIIGRQFGAASSKVVIEQYLKGIELSVFALTDGKQYSVIGHAKDYKRIGEGDTGLNTGGMGCVTPVPFADDAFLKKVEEQVIKPTIDGFAAEAMDYKGFVFFGLMNCNGEPYVIEYNCRMGDPETEVVLPRLKNDLVELFIAMNEGELGDVQIEFEPQSIATVVAVSGGYPGSFEKNKMVNLPVYDLTEGSIIFHAGTKQSGNNVVTNGGRVLAVTSYGDSIPQAVEKSKKLLEKVYFDGMYYRKDIGYEF
jgi:phosphoribosylamine---glycine ligase